jgi:hypothetical protein
MIASNSLDKKKKDKAFDAHDIMLCNFLRPLFTNVKNKLDSLSLADLSSLF